MALKSVFFLLVFLVLTPMSFAMATGTADRLCLPIGKEAECVPQTQFTLMVPERGVICEKQGRNVAAILERFSGASVTGIKVRAERPCDIAFTFDRPVHFSVPGFALGHDKTSTSQQNQPTRDLFRFGQYLDLNECSFWVESRIRHFESSTGEKVFAATCSLDDRKEDRRAVLWLFTETSSTKQWIRYKFRFPAWGNEHQVSPQLLHQLNKHLSHGGERTFVNTLVSAYTAHITYFGKPLPFRLTAFAPEGIHALDLSSCHSMEKAFRESMTKDFQHPLLLDACYFRGMNLNYAPTFVVEDRPHGGSYSILLKKKYWDDEHPVGYYHPICRREAEAYHAMGTTHCTDTCERRPRPCRPNAICGNPVYMYLLRK